MYQIKKHTAINFISTTQNILIADSTLLEDSDRIHYSIKPNWLLHNKKKASLISLNRLKSYNNNKNIYSKKGLLDISNVKILLANKNIGYYTFQNKSPKVPIDILLITNNYPVKNIKQILTHFSPKKILIDGSNNLYYIKKINKLIHNYAHTKIIDTRKKGAYFLSLK